MTKKSPHEVKMFLDSVERVTDAIRGLSKDGHSINSANTEAPPKPIQIVPFVKGTHSTFLDSIQKSLDAGHSPVCPGPDVDHTPGSRAWRVDRAEMTDMAHKEKIYTHGRAHAAALERIETAHEAVGPAALALARATTESPRKTSRATARATVVFLAAQAELDAALAAEEALVAAWPEVQS